MQQIYVHPNPAGQRIAIDITPLGMGRLHRRTFRAVVPSDATETQIWTVLVRLAQRNRSRLAWLGIGFSYDDILYGSRNVSTTDDPVTSWDSL